MNCEFPDVQAGFRKGKGSRDQIANIHWIIEKAREIHKKHPLMLYWLHQSLWLCGSQQTVENFERDGNTRPPDLPPEKSVCTSRSNSWNWSWNNRLVQNLERSMPRLYIVILLILLICRILMRNAGMDEAQAGIKITGRNTNNLRYADATTVMA